MLTAALNSYISNAKGSDYRIDQRISSGYLVDLTVRRLFMKLRGYAKFPLRQHKPFIGPGVGIKGRHLIDFGRTVTLDRGSYIDAMSSLGVTLGSNVSLGKNSRIECTGNIQNIGRGFRAGDNVGLGTDNLFGSAGGIEIGSDTIFGNYTSLHSENHNISDIDVPIRLQGVTRQGIRIGSDCWIGSRVTILDGATIGDGCVFAAGSVVPAGEYKSYGIYGGVPAKLLRKRKA
ncbi:acyltransferase [Rhodococcus sp. MSC1_016]|jgi:acetyltransferase-like isoleucine patch superfamily enzyme|uniref:acyltransferase n=1 Tax=Rhodococcus sp. MSC1_016 TaxID=2909266 RepID=UPI00203010F5|nr:acyltransferase [Rhodococcus sp. MSC1_016]